MLPDSKLQYRPEIDGLRAIAVLGVIFYHYGFGVPGGFVGVDVFFVISGFLITSLIVQDLRVGRLAFAGFWARRVRRILPAATLVVVATLAAGWWLMLPEAYEKLGESVLWQAAFASNIFFWKSSGYFAPKAQESPLLHTWSLSVEEQFYMVVPVVLAVLFANTAKRSSAVTAVSLFAAACVASFGASLYATRYHPSAGFYLLPFRAWELMLGSMLALLPIKSAAVSVNSGAVYLGAAAVIASMLLYSSATPFPGLAALAPCLGAVLIIWGASGSSSLLTRVLSSALLVGIGKISYSLYLWHWPLLVLADYYFWEKPLPLLTRIYLLSGTIVLSLLSWRFVERPFRSGFKQVGTGLVLASGLITIALAGALGAGIWLSKGVPQRLPAEVLAFSHVERLEADGGLNLQADQVKNREMPVVGSKDERITPDVLIWGDSSAMVLVEAFDKILQARNRSAWVATRYSTAPVFDTFWKNPIGGTEIGPAMIEFNNAVRSLLREGEVRDVIIAANWENYRDQLGEVPLAKALEDTIAQLRKENIGVWVFAQIPNQSFDVDKSLAQSILYGRDIRPLLTLKSAYKPFGDASPQLNEALSATGAIILNTEPLFLSEDGERYRVTNSAGQSLYENATHVRPSRMYEFLQPVLEKLLVGERQEPTGHANQDR